MCWWRCLDKGKNTTGSRPRCVSIIDGSPVEVAERLTNLVNRPEVVIGAKDIWKPAGPPRLVDGAWDETPATEAKLDHDQSILPSNKREMLRDWWLTHSNSANTPNWDIVSTCKIGEKAGILLVEGKAHRAELANEERGKPLGPKTNFDNHLRIGQAISDMSAILRRDIGEHFAISRDLHYQMSNRFALACKLTEMGYPVVLIYLGFLKAKEMPAYFTTPEEWEKLVKNHSAPLFPDKIWNNTWTVNEQKFIPLIRTAEPTMPAGFP